jgi:redox-sensitive bicupin YhaK (pirin superfamily)
MFNSVIQRDFIRPVSIQHIPAKSFPYIHPIHWLHSHFAVGGWSPLQKLSGMLTAHMTSIAPQNGFTWHPHRGLEIFTWVLEGTLYHEDTTGGKGHIKAGEFQRMFSGPYIEHQELNRTDEDTRVIQIWFIADPKYQNLPPHYQQLSQSEIPKKKSGDAEVFSLIGEDSPMEQHMHGRLTATTLKPGERMALDLPRSDEDLFLYVTDGSGTLILENDSEVNNEKLIGQYDVILARSKAPGTNYISSFDDPLCFLSFYLPKFL